MSLSDITCPQCQLSGNTICNECFALGLRDLDELPLARRNFPGDEEESMPGLLDTLLQCTRRDSELLDSWNEFIDNVDDYDTNHPFLELDQLELEELLQYPEVLAALAA